MADKPPDDTPGSLFEASLVHQWSPDTSSFLIITLHSHGMAIDAVPNTSTLNKQAFIPTH